MEYFKGWLELLQSNLNLIRKDYRTVEKVKIGDLWIHQRLGALGLGEEQTVNMRQFPAALIFTVGKPIFPFNFLPANNALNEILLPALFDSQKDHQIKVKTDIDTAQENTYQMRELSLSINYDLTENS